MIRSEPGTRDTHVADILRTRTSTAHRDLEAHVHQKVLLADRVDASFVASYVDALLPVHRTIEERIAAEDDARVEAMFRPYHRRSAEMEHDLRRLGRRPDEFARPDCVQPFVDEIERGSLPFRVGVWYVLEGATNGGRFLADRVGRALDPEAPVTLSFFDPYGHEQPARWAEFRRGLETFADEIDACADGACRAFAFHADLFDARMAGGSS